MFKTRKAKGDKPTCKHCGKYGHKEANCFKSLGYLAGSITRGRWSGCARGHGGQHGRTGGRRGQGYLAAQVVQG